MSPAENVLSLQMFLITMTVPLMFLAAVVQEHRETARALRETQERVAQAEALSIVMVAHVALDGRWLRAPPTLGELLGYSESELCSRRLEDVVNPEDFAVDWGQCQRLVRGEIQSFDHETRLVHRDGRRVWVFLTASLVTDAAGRPLHFLVYFKDINRRKRDEQALHESSERIRDLAARLITAQEEERRRIARDLHDDLNQQVAAVAIRLSVLKRRLAEEPEPLESELLEIQRSVSGIADRVRAMSHELHSSALEHAGLVAAVASLCAEFREQRGIAVALETRGELETVPPAVQLCVYRVVQEALRNVAKHSSATSAGVVLSENARRVRLVVRDGGVGFDGGRARHGGGLGLVSMEERVRALAGRFHVTTSPDKGTELVAEIPFEPVSHD
jgi:PAS domain S-box-containing protein